jgi:methionyl-tRNA formyltransferase
MGTPEFALPSLKALIESPYSIIGVVTQPDRPKGRGRHLVPPPVKILAEEQGLSIWQPEKVREPGFIEFFNNMAPDLVAVVAFGQILPSQIVFLPPFGCINVHPSLLPKYRGAAPMNWTLIQGETRTGMTIILMDEGMDSGDILLQKEIPVEPEDYYDMLHDRLADMGAKMLLKSIKGKLDNTIAGIPQDHTRATFAPRLKKEDGLIQWDQDGRSIINRIRGLSSFPGAYTFLEGKMLKIYKADFKESPVIEKPGTVVVECPEGLCIAAGNGHILLTDIQMENRRRMPVHEFLRGFRLHPGLKLG